MSRSTKTVRARLYAAFALAGVAASMLAPPILILQGGLSAVDAMCDRPPGLSPADVRNAGVADQVSPLSEQRGQSARVLPSNTPEGCRG
jgi:hypothetical protein